MREEAEEEKRRRGAGDQQSVREHPVAAAASCSLITTLNLASTCVRWHRPAHTVGRLLPAAHRSRICPAPTRHLPETEEKERKNIYSSLLEGEAASRRATNINNLDALSFQVKPRGFQ